MEFNALTALNRNRNSSLLNPFQVEGLYPNIFTHLDILPFKLPNKLLLKNLPYLFNTVSVWQELSLYEQIINPLSSWHILVDGCIVEDLILPISTSSSALIEGPIHIKTITLDKPLSFTNDIYTLQITKYVGSVTKRITHNFHISFLYRAFLGITNPVIDTYIAVVKDILNGQSDNKLYIKGHSIEYVSDVLYINNQAYSNIDLSIVAWLMYTLFN